MPVPRPQSAPPPGQSRLVTLDGGNLQEGFRHNGIKTSKYNPVTFFPIFLFEMFSRAAYLYFLIQVPPSPLSPSRPLSRTGPHAHGASITRWCEEGRTSPTVSMHGH